MNRYSILLLVFSLCFLSPAQAQISNLGDITNAFNKLKKTSDSTARISKGASGLSLEEEIAIGDAVAVAIVVRYGGVWRDEEATRRINLIGRILAQYATRQDLEWRFGLLDSNAINAFSAPGGRVFITRGLYELPLNDDELAGVLAHEIIHIDDRHAIDIIARGELKGGVSELIADNNASYAQYESIVGKATDVILEDGFDPGTEYEADEGGRSLASVTGYAPGGLRTVLIRIDDSTEKPDEVFSTHPDTAARLKRLPKDPPPGDAEPQVAQD
jgi:predicted Zn-dependent protease